MSGIEIAGLVLGALPLLITAIEEYSRLYEDFKAEAQTLENLRYTLEAEHLSYRYVCADLLDGIVPKHEIVRLIGSGLEQMPEWNSPTLESRLQKKLAHVYERFIGLIKVMDTTIKRFAEELNLDQKFKIRLGHSPDFMRRLKFAYRTPVFKKLAAELRQKNELLWTLSRQRLEFDIRLDHGVENQMPDSREMLRIRECATSLHLLFRACFKCPCCIEHTASIRLNTLREALVNVSAPGRMGVGFGFLLSYSTNPSYTSVPWIIENVEVHTYQQKQPANDFIMDSSAEQVPGAKLRFYLASSACAPRICTSCPLSDPRSRVFNLCEALCNSTGPQEREYRGHLLDEINHSHGQFILNLPKKKLEPLEIVGLQALTQPGAPFSEPGLTPGKMQIAIDVATAVMELNGTPWLSPVWGRDDIELSGTVTGPGFDCSHTFSTHFLSKSLIGQRQKMTCPWTRFPSRNKTIFYLGILLAEIGLGTSFDEALESRRRQTGEETDFANPWKEIDWVLDKIHTEIDSDYSEVVRRCIYCDFDHRQVSFESGDFYGVFYSKVVSRLQRTNNYLSI
ncbi:hypothetical protein HDK64DRAFT_263719 [Phyllosticta capitalensis]